MQSETETPVTEVGTATGQSPYFGQYRAMHLSLFVDDDYRPLSERASWALVALRMNLHWSGIEIRRPLGLAETLAEQTKMPFDAAKAALAELEAAGWIRRDGSVLWIVRQLALEPAMKPTNPKHRIALARHLATLPATSLRDAFAEHYPEWFADVGDSLSDSLDQSQIQIQIQKNRSTTKPRVSRARGAALARARERWALYRERGMTANQSQAWWAEQIEKVVADGHASSADAFRDELRAVKPWDISERAKSADWAVAEVARRLAALANAA